MIIYLSLEGLLRSYNFNIPSPKPATIKLPVTLSLVRQVTQLLDFVGIS